MAAPISHRHNIRLEDCGVSSGIWRLRFHPDDPNLLLCAQMYKGVSVFRISGDDIQTGSGCALIVVENENSHGSIVYGIDWISASTGQTIISSCSFYDSLVQIWSRRY